MGEVVVDVRDIGEESVFETYTPTTVASVRGTVYSVIAAVIIFLFSFSEHIIAMYLADMAGELAGYFHLITIAIIVITFNPLKHRLERKVDAILANRKVEF